MFRRLIAAVLAGGVLIVAASIAVGWMLTRPFQESIGAPPEDLGAETVSFASSPQTTVSGWWCPVAPTRGSILLLPGIRANRLSMIDRARFLRRAGYSVLLIDLRATGETKARHITFGWDERQDVLAAVDFLRRKDPQVKIGIIGSSLGGAAALFASPSLKVDALVIEAVYPTIGRATLNRLEKYTGRYGRWLSPFLLMQLKPRLGISASDLRPVDHVNAVTSPLFIIGGANDRNTTVEDTKLLFAAAQEPKELWMVDRADHVDLHHFAKSEYESRVVAFFDRNLTPP